MIIDTHIHIWDFDRAEYVWLKDNDTILNRTYSIDELEKDRRDAGITEGILVQAANNTEDTEWMLQVARRTGWIKGVVGWLPLINPDATSQMVNGKYGDESYFKGVRHLIHDEADTRWLLQPPVIESLRVLAQKDIPYDLVGVLTQHVETALEVAATVPALRMVFDHLNQPPIASGQRFGKWGELMKEASQHKNFYAKISGLGTAAGSGDSWQPKDFAPYIEFVLQHFGTERCFCGGDWPVSLLAGNYTRVWDAYKTILKELVSKQEMENILYHNAKRFYSV